MFDAVDPPVAIRAEVSLADPDTCKFTVSRTLHPRGPFFFETKEQAAGSPLPERLFALHGVADVLLIENVVTVRKAPSASWSGLKAAIGAAIRTQLLSGVPAVLEMSRETSAQGRTDAEIRALVQALLDKEVNRSIAGHGGKISIVDLRGARLTIAMSGATPMARTTFDNTVARSDSGSDFQNNTLRSRRSSYSAPIQKKNTPMANTIKIGMAMPT